MIDYLLDRVNCLLDDAPAHLVALASGFCIIVGLWVLGHQVGLL